ncbi:MAG: two-component hybrid sensor and regulator [Candidatus Magnetoglobus multicellularis str. Araruama]|uniref:histidine kinase n=1 Tax=Candidatus Magnetoglobus multicellularis str. Araruama TaxID=890399 RepID=A0A1V1PBU4_9BACT|nr:MAG: two-component hybrid sensor and regulator [Candidatus Magnetoglobus multicellularis str. Araruama]
MEKKATHVLIIDDNYDDAKKYQEMLSTMTSPYTTNEHVSTLIKAFSRLKKGGVDLILLDLFLPESKSIKTLNKTHDRFSTIPIIALTRFGDEDTGVKAVGEGAMDYLVKGDITKNAFIRSIRYSLERHRVEDAERKIAEKLRHANAELEGFTYSVSHDLRAPLRSIIGFSEIIDKRYRDRKLDEKGQHYLNNIIQAGKQMGMLIDDLLDYSRVGQGGLSVESVDLNELFSKIIKGLTSKISETKGTIHVPDDLPVIKSNATLVTQIFSNLLSNALTFHHQDIPPVIELTHEDLSHYWSITVSDNGIGIPTEHHERIFKVFQRLHTQDEYVGTGIGLSIVKKAIQHMGGNISLDSTPGKGTSFTIKFPKKPKV